MKPLGLMLPTMKNKAHAYFLEGKRELIDHEVNGGTTILHNDSTTAPANQMQPLDLRIKLNRMRLV